MRLAQVIGPVWGARHADGLHGRKILLLRTLDGGEVCAVDALGAGPGEWVLYAHGSRVRDLTLGPTVAEKDIVVAIVDDVDAMLSQGRAGLLAGAHPASEESTR